ncbi:MAG: type II toxin-antitoxin system death-on-curing family toxin [Candidatus Cloacimonadota bacterium]|nr:MAG: type II toxin-antitoxin system death-on-curing family toxin [Candidatus Cloacimonadota bacterium]
MIDYLTIVEVLSIHENLINVYGGSHGIRDMGALESSLFRPQSGYYSDVIQQASALWESLSQNHPFIDGNKRVSFACVYTFLLNNDIEITANSDEVYNFMMKLFENSTFNFEHLDKWLRVNTTSN